MFEEAVYLVQVGPRLRSQLAVNPIVNPLREKRD